MNKFIEEYDIPPHLVQALNVIFALLLLFALYKLYKHYKSK